ncbi:MAG TPA: Ig-like domain-containing protein [Gemmatimonadales bacterium]|nr:Ig-like domain-containing protein [Gemmatimonadales bacterium]
MTIALLTAAIALMGACGSDNGPNASRSIEMQSGDDQTGAVGEELAPLVVRVLDANDAPEANVEVTWAVVSGGGSIIPTTVLTDGGGLASATFTLGPDAGNQQARASAAEADGSPVSFHATAMAGPATQMMKSGGDGQTGIAGSPLAQPYSAVIRDAFDNPVAGVEVAWAVTSGGGSVSSPTSTSDAAGIARVTHTLGAAAGPQTVTATVEGLTGSPLTFSSNASVGIRLVTTVGVTANYGLHDTFVRDGLAFLCAWNTGILIYDVGNGFKGGSPSNPQFVSSVVTGGGKVHNAWWYHSPLGAKKYLFVGEEGPGSIGGTSSGDIHLVDVSNLSSPVEVGSYHLSGAGTHNFWVDEVNQVLFAAYYNGGVVALDISGSLPANLATRELDRIQPGGAGNTYVWGVMQHQGAVYAMDMVSGFWKLGFSGGSFAIAGGGNNVPERYGSDLWLHGSHAYTGTWGFRAAQGNAVKVWQVGAGAPVLVDSVITELIGTVSDVQVTDDGQLLVFSAENGANAGLHVYSLADPAHPTYLAKYLVSTGLHTATISVIDGKTYVFGARNPSSPALMIFDISSLLP